MLQSISGHNINLDVKTNETFFFNIHNESTHLHVWFRSLPYFVYKCKQLTGAINISKKIKTTSLSFMAKLTNRLQ